MTRRIAGTFVFGITAAMMWSCVQRNTTIVTTTTPSAVVVPVAVPSMPAANQDPIASVSSVVFDASKSTSSSSGGLTGYLWTFGDGSQAAGVQVLHLFATAGEKVVTLTVSDANGTSAPATISVTIKDLTGTWQAPFNVQTRTYTLVQSGSVISGTYTNTALLRQEWPVSGSVDTSRRFTITATYPGETAVVLSNAVIDANVASFAGVTLGGSADGQMLTYRRVP